ncbi:hypothetical protein M0208_06335 [Sphingomonas sp. SUN019]|uniref:hypothetical protein n=1 Tax=Sphingomonas sp. SUN019 TaxID=2937788 RepID=UPI0021643EFF|nr:hypothetical protein [Sphingomonas sp. SUN019]UVO50155.1 hypothetical protein M0208_06335 [Sphingomonas sp. SUN019]
MIALSGALLVAPAIAGAQVVPVTPTAAPIVVGAPVQDVLRSGTSVSLTMSEPLTTKGKKLRVGQRFQMAVAEPVMVNGQIVIPAGSPATGEVTEVRNKGMWGKSGAINARVLYVRANGRQIRLSGQLDDKGKTGTAGVIGAVALLPIAGFFTTGTSAAIPLGAPVTAFVDEDLPVAFAGGAPAPMNVPIAAPAPVAVSAPALTPAAAIVKK